MCALTSHLQMSSSFPAVGALSSPLYFSHIEKRNPDTHVEGRGVYICSASSCKSKLGWSQWSRWRQSRCQGQRARFSLLGSGECSRHSAAGDSELGWAPNAQKQFCLNQLEALISRPPSDLILLGRRPFYTTSLEPCVPISCIYVYRVLLVTA